MPGPSVVDRVLGVLGVQPSTIVAAIYRTIISIKDKKARLSAVEVASLTAIEYNDVVGKAVAGDHSEVASSVKDALLKANRNTLGILARAADLDESISEG